MGEFRAPIDCDLAVLFDCEDKTDAGDRYDQLGRQKIYRPASVATRWPKLGATDNAMTEYSSQCN